MNLLETTGRLDESTYTALKNAASENWNYSAAKAKLPQKPRPKAADSSELPSGVTVSVARAGLHDAPGSGGKVLATLRHGAKLLVQGEDKDCYFVVTEDGKKGWIHKSMTKE
jgi:hypothetical protein